MAVHGCSNKPHNAVFLIQKLFNFSKTIDHLHSSDLILKLYGFFLIEVISIMKKKEKGQ